MAEIGNDIIKAKKILEQGELVAIPTETVYGLAGNATDPEAILKIFKVKNRPYFDPLIVHVPSLEKAHDLVEEFPKKAIDLATHFWPGPLTLILKRKPIIPDLVTSGLETVGVRCPDHSLTLELLKSLSFPLAAPSANPFGYISPTSAMHVNDQLGDKINYILDGGPCNIGLESTIVGFEDAIPTIYRLGGLSVDAIESIVGKTSMQLNISSNPLAPGQLKTHYAPRKKMFVGEIGSLLAQHKDKRVGILAFTKSIAGVASDRQLILSPKGSIEEAAQKLFASLRELDKMDIDIIVAQRVPETGLGSAINDRLIRAAS
jgi:L-threonylcarbamoyladenylate synthase